MKLIKYFAIGILLLSTLSIFPCGPFFENAIFSFLYNQYDNKSYLLGKPIFIKPSFFRRDLTVAYRYLIGKEKIKETLDLYSEYDPAENIDSPMTQWLKQRQAALNLKTPGKDFPTWRYVKGGSYTNYVNCMDDAFRFASENLQKKVNAYGIKSREVITWVTGQDIVFSNCGSESVNIPSNLNYPQDHPLTKDRKYQIAAAYFYGGEFDSAKKQLEAIAEDKFSPYQGIAPYLIVRTLIRKASLKNLEGYEKGILKEAETASSRLLSTSKDENLKNAISNQWNYIQYYLNPMEYLKESEKAILTNSKLADTTRNDFANLLEKFPEESKKASPMADWILNFRTEEKKASLEYARKKWNETKSTPWFVSVITKTSFTDKETNTILEEARKYTKDSYAYLTVSYHRIRLLLEQGRIPAAQNLLKEILGYSNLDPSDKNLFSNFKVYLANTEKEFIQSGYLKPIGHSYDSDSNEMFEKETEKSKSQPHFTKAFAQIWNKEIPLDRMLRIYLTEKVPTHLEENLLFSLFARATLLKRLDIVETLNSKLSKYPFLKKELELFQKANTKEEKEFIGILTLLRLPGIKPYIQFGYFRSNIAQIDDYRDNWWCAFEELREEEGDGFPMHPIFKYSRLKIISEQEEKQAEEEWKILTELGTAPDYLSAKVIEFSKTLPNNTDLPEALHRAVKTTRYGCAGDKTSEYSKNAFRILHKKFPNSEWASKTQFHF